MRLAVGFAVWKHSSTAHRAPTMWISWSGMVPSWSGMVLAGQWAMS
ncbi:hypothetical protein [Streptomyces fradiae]